MKKDAGNAVFFKFQWQSRWVQNFNKYLLILCSVIDLIFHHL